MARRGATVAGFGVVLTLALTASPAAGQQCTGPACGASVSELGATEPPVVSPTASEGLLRETNAAGPEATAAVAAGLLVVGSTLTAIVRRRLAVTTPVPVSVGAEPATASVSATVPVGARVPSAQWDPGVIERRAAGFLREPARPR